MSLRPFVAIVIIVTLTPVMLIGLLAKALIERAWNWAAK